MKKIENMENKPVILIVDDISSNIQILAAVLKDDYRLKIATNGLRALELAASNPPVDLILLDVKMPEMDGYEVLSRLKADSTTKDIPVMFVTGKDSTLDEEKGLVAGAVDYITKPIRPIIVRARVKIHMTIKHQKDQLKYLALHDNLTGLYNRHHLDDEGGRKFARALRQGHNLSIIMADIDHFKTINDNYGHIVGDKILKSIADVLNSNKRVEDFTARYGGEEFVLLLEDSSAEDAKIKAESLRKIIESMNPEGIAITASFGVVTFNKRHKDLDDMLKDADEALYVAKESGRNRVVIFMDEEL
jgi:diguanylate cyclase (GGDEF)-like protein